MSLGHEHGFVLIGLAGPMDVVNLSLSLKELCKAQPVATKTRMLTEMQGVRVKSSALVTSHTECRTPRRLAETGCSML